MWKQAGKNPGINYSKVQFYYKLWGMNSREREDKSSYNSNMRSSLNPRRFE